MRGLHLRDHGFEQLLLDAEQHIDMRARRFEPMSGVDVLDRLTRLGRQQRRPQGRDLGSGGRRGGGGVGALDVDRRVSLEELDEFGFLGFEIGELKDARR